MLARAVSTLLTVLCAGTVCAYEPSAREHPFKPLREAAVTQAREDAPGSLALVGTIETSRGFEALIEGADGRVVRGQVGDPVMDGHLIADVWAEGAALKTPQGRIELRLRGQPEAPQ